MASGGGVEEEGCRVGAGHHSSGGHSKMGGADGSEESSESEDGEHKDSYQHHRRVSTNKAIKNGVCLKEGYLMKQTTSFQRWKRRFFKLTPRKVYYAKDCKSPIWEELELADLSLAECGPKNNVNHAFQLITPFRRMVLGADTRKDMDEWMATLRNVANKQFINHSGALIGGGDSLSGQHNWFVTSHARPTYCNVCREALSGVRSHGLSCEVCKFKVHKRCAVKASSNCKWTTLASVGKHILEDEQGTISMPHQWLEGNLPVSAKCSLCDKTCGSVLRLADWKCLWCRTMVHSGCIQDWSRICPLGPCWSSVVPPIALHSMSSSNNEEWGFNDAPCWEGLQNPPGCAPLLVFVNSKSGDNQGVKFLRRFKQLLNPAQVFDLMNGQGPNQGIAMFRSLNPLRILVCGGDGSVSWVLTEIDKLGLHKQCQMGVLPLGTGNDLARVLGWGSVCDDDAQLAQLLEKYERANTKSLDRWSIMTLEGNGENAEKTSCHSQFGHMSMYEDSVIAHLGKILQSDQHSVVISSAKVLCETVKDFIAKVGVAASGPSHQPVEQDSVASKCLILNEKMDLLLRTLNDECSQLEDEKKDEEKRVPPPPPPTGEKKKKFVQKEALMSRANSLKKAVRQIIEHTEKAVDEQNIQTTAQMPSSGCPKITLGPPGINIESECDESPLWNNPKWCSGGGGMGSSVGASLKNTLQVTLPTIEGGSSAECSPCPSPKPFQLPPTSPVNEPHPRPHSPTATRRISQGATLNRLGAIGLQLGACSGIPIFENVASTTTQDDPMVHKAIQRSRRFPIINPLASLPLWPNLNKESLIGQVLLANSDVLCAAASPLMDLEQSANLDGFYEKCVMNNYFGIGLDAKITLEFHHKREEHPEKCRSRTKNLMWYGVLGGKELLQRTFKNLEQRVQLECDGCPIPLPSLQGIVVLNIPSYGGGSNFWGQTTKEEQKVFYAPAIDDRILEVVAVFGTAQMAASRVINLQHHRIAQCRSVKITILGEEGVPVQVDGEAWVQPPGYIRLVHKNTAQVLCRNRQLESTLKSWQQEQHQHRGWWQQQQQSHPLRLSRVPLTEAEMLHFDGCVNAARTLIESLKRVWNILPASCEQVLFPLTRHVGDCLDRLFPSNGTSGVESRRLVSDFVSSVYDLHATTRHFVQSNCGNINTDIQTELDNGLLALETQLAKCSRAQDVFVFHGLDEQSATVGGAGGGGGLFRMKFLQKGGSAKATTPTEQEYSVCPGGGKCGTPTRLVQCDAISWDSTKVGEWLDSIQLGEYKTHFERHDVTGPELIDLERRDLKDLGITKVGHVKRILQAIKDIQQ